MWPSPEFLLHGSPRPADAASRRGERINAARSHLPCHPRERQQHGEGQRPGRDFDFGAPRPLLTDAAARAGAAIMRHYREKTEVELKGDAEPRDARRPRLGGHHSRGACGLRAPHPGRLGGGRRRRWPRSERASSWSIRSTAPRSSSTSVPTSPSILRSSRTDARAFGLVYAPALKLLAITPSDGIAVEAELQPDPRGADFAALRPTPLKVRTANPEGADRGGQPLP